MPLSDTLVRVFQVHSILHCMSENMAVFRLSKSMFSTEYHSIKTLSIRQHTAQNCSILRKVLHAIPTIKICVSFNVSSRPVHPKSASCDFLL